jgi:putative transposase
VLRVQRSTYYKHFSAPESKRSIENQRIRRAILELYSKYKQRFGAEKINRRLKAEYGIHISNGRVYRLMKGMELPKASTVRPKPAAQSMLDGSDCVNHINGRFNPKTPDKVWVSDITYIRVNGRFAYVCVVIDLYARKLIAYKVSTKIDTKLTIDTFNAAYASRREPKGVLFHTDRGSQYLSIAFRRRMDQVKFIQSFSAKGHPYDNAVAESFIKSLKQEEINRRLFLSVEELELALFEYAHFYNNSRPHSANDGLTPNEKERRGDLLE